MKKRYIVLIFLLIVVIYFYQNPYTMNDDMILARPSLKNLLGCDNLGRDIFSRLVLGSFILFS
ncbi:glutathione ABC transporter permease GsiD [Fusobacterium varium]|nr:hypothetical protein [Fusobacterium varium]VEH40625.1 glutathione ABC transporter permease GsiD [Fusobacterium varium]